jgi:hypothetical protein
MTYFVARQHLGGFAGGSSLLVRHSGLANHLYCSPSRWPAVFIAVTRMRADSGVRGARRLSPSCRSCGTGTLRALRRCVRYLFRLHGLLTSFPYGSRCSTLLLAS